MARSPRLAHSSVVLFLCSALAVVLLSEARLAPSIAPLRRLQQGTSCAALTSELSSTDASYYSMQVNDAQRVQGDASAQNCVYLACGWLNLVKPALGTLPASPQTAETVVSDCADTVIQQMQTAGVSSSDIQSIGNAFTTCANEGFSLDQPTLRSQLQAYCSELVDFSSAGGPTAAPSVLDPPSSDPPITPSADPPTTPSADPPTTPSADPPTTSNAGFPSARPGGSSGIQNLGPTTGSQKAAASLATASNGALQLLLAALGYVAIRMMA